MTNHIKAMQCKNCQTPVDPNWNYCSWCSAKLGNVKKKPRKTTSRSKNEPLDHSQKSRRIKSFQCGKCGACIPTSSALSRRYCVYCGQKLPKRKLTTKEFITCLILNRKRQIICILCKGKGKGRCSDCDGSGEEKCPVCKGKKNVNKRCPECDKNGGITCYKCDGDGSGGFLGCGSCKVCGGDGRVKCLKCSGTKKVRVKCSRCKGTGRIKCSTCKGTRKGPCIACNGESRIEIPTCFGSYGNYLRCSVRKGVLSRNKSCFFAKECEKSKEIIKLVERDFSCPYCASYTVQLLKEKCSTCHLVIPKTILESEYARTGQKY